MQKLLIITPHLSTGGCPQVVLKKIKLLSDYYQIFCIEYNFLSPHYVVQRKKIKNLLDDRFIPLFDNKESIIEHINKISPDIIFIEEFSETFIDLNILKFIFRKDRNYKIFESTHSSEDKSSIKKFLPDKFIFVSEWSKKMYTHLNIPVDVIEYPVDKKDKNTSIMSQLISDIKTKLFFDSEYKHIVNIGLFTPGKNQKYIFDIAKELSNEKIKFHFIGNQAPNFKEYWEPLINNKTDNCIIWGEKDNTDEFLMSSDLFLFTSKFELNPLVVKESLEFEVPTLMFNLETYCKKYDNIKSISFLTGDIKEDISKIKRILYE